MGARRLRDGVAHPGRPNSHGTSRRSTAAGRRRLRGSRSCVRRAVGGSRDTGRRASTRRLGGSHRPGCDWVRRRRRRRLRRLGRHRGDDRLRSGPAAQARPRQAALTQAPAPPRPRLGLGRGHGKASGQQRGRVDVAVRIRGDADAEVDVGHTRHGVLAVADLADDRALRDHAAGRDDGRAELEQRDRVAVGSQDRDRATAARHRTGEGDGSCGRGAHRRAESRTDVDAAVLAGGVAVLGDGERSQDRPVGRPGPTGRDRDDDQGCDRRSDRDGEHAPHRVPPS